jgi:hypothetical protein
MKGKHFGICCNREINFDSLDMTDIASNNVYDKGFQEEIKKRCNELIEEIKKKYPEVGIDLKEVGYGRLSFLDIMDLEALLIDLDANIEDYKKEDNMEMLFFIYAYPHSSRASTARRLEFKVKKKIGEK